MKINTSNLRNLYKVLMINQLNNSRKHCPPPKDLVKSIRSRFVNKKVLLHVAQCPYCMKEIKLLIGLFEEESKFINFLTKKSISKSGKHTIKTRILIYASAPLIVFIIVSSLLILNKPNSNLRHRVYSNSYPVLVAPVRNSISVNSLNFVWKPISGSQFYCLELFDEKLFSIISVNQISKCKLSINEEMASRLEKGKKYHWMIYAYFFDGTYVESEIAEFQILD